MIHETLQVAQRLDQEGISTEVIDVATLRPLDMDTILASVSRTGRCVIVTEAPRSGSFAAEISANLAEHGLLSLFAPVMRVTSYDVVVPLSRLEQIYMPDVEYILEAVRKCLAFS